MNSTEDAKRWLRGLWAYYLAYTNTAVHAATAASFAIFALLVFLDPLFAILAIGSYVVPPIVLYIREGGVPDRRARKLEESDVLDSSSGLEASTASPSTSRGHVPDADPEVSAGDSDGGRDSDSDSDSDDGDSDSDSDGGDSDTDSNTDS
ncbi:hypothetical protein [Halomontanus rarus]|uniref:hypothetical protein n=1 Tax=Halomontanus rarus TaxID=3034020 RepID=UPI001A98EEDC